MAFIIGALVSFAHIHSLELGFIDVDMGKIMLVMVHSVLMSGRDTFGFSLQVGKLRPKN